MFIAQPDTKNTNIKNHFILQLPSTNVYYLSRIIVNLESHYIYDIFLLHHLFGLENEPQVYIHFLIFYRISLVRRAKISVKPAYLFSIFSKFQKIYVCFLPFSNCKSHYQWKKKIEKKTFFSKFAKNNLEFKFHPTNSFVLLEQLSKSS